MKAKVTIATEMFGAARTIPPPFERVAGWAATVVEFKPRDPIAQPPSGAVRFVNGWSSVRLIPFKDPLFAIGVEEQSGMGRLSQHPPKRDLGGFSFLLAAANIGMTTGEPNLLRLLKLISRIRPQS